MRPTIPTVLILALGTAAGSAFGQPAPERVRFALCRSNVASVEVIRGPRPALAVQLASPARQELSSLTESNRGGILEVTFADRLFLEGPIREAIRSGTFLNGGFASIDDALAAGRELERALTAEPCGASAAAAPVPAAPHSEGAKP